MIAAITALFTRPAAAKRKQIQPRAQRGAAAYEQAAMLLAPSPAAHTSLIDAGGVASLLSAPQEEGAHKQAARLLARDSAEHARLEDPRAIASLLDELREAGANEQVASLAARAAESTSHSLIEAGTGRRYLRTDLTSPGVTSGFPLSGMESGHRKDDIGDMPKGG